MHQVKNTDRDQYCHYQDLVAENAVCVFRDEIHVPPGAERDDSSSQKRSAESGSLYLSERQTSGQNVDGGGRQIFISATLHLKRPHLWASFCRGNADRWDVDCDIGTLPSAASVSGIPMSLLRLRVSSSAHEDRRQAAPDGVPDMSTERAR